MSKYGTFPASPTTDPPPDASTSSAALDNTSNSSADAPGESAVADEPAPVRRPWRELADPRALSVPRGLADARCRARGNLSRFAANYELVFFVAVLVALLWRSIFLPVVVPFLFAAPGNVIRLLLAFTPLLLLVTSDTDSVLISLPVALLLVVSHAVLHDDLPTESDGSIDDDEAAGLCYKPEPPSNKIA